MDAAKFSNFTIDYILGERTGPQTHAAGLGNSSSVSQPFQKESSKVRLSPAGGFQPQASGAAGLGFQSPCPGIYDPAPCYNSFHCCGPVMYYQTKFNMNYCGGEHWFHQYPECDKGETLCVLSLHRHRNRVRTVFTESQVTRLDHLFSITDYPSAEARAQLARSTGLSEETVRVWFKNRRARRKRQKTSSDSTDS